MFITRKVSRAKYFFAPDNHISAFVLTLMLISVSNCQQSSTNSVQLFKSMICGTERTDLYCHTNEDTMQSVSSDDSESSSRHKARYESIDLVFDNGEYNLTSEFFKDVNPFFQIQPTYGKIEFRVKFQNFKALYLHDKFFNSICDSLHNNVGCHLTLNVYNSKTSDFIVSSGVFQDLRADTLVVHNAHLTGVSFQTLFKNANIKVLDLKGTYIDCDGSIPYTGYIGKVILTKQASKLDSDEFPQFPVPEYVINAQNIQSISGETFVDYGNIKELNLKSKSLVIRPGNLQHFHNLKKLSLEDVIVESGGFRNLEHIEELEIGSGVSMRPDAIADISKIKNLRKIRIDNGEQSTDVRLMCELATSISQLPSTLSDLAISVGNKCTCEHKYIAHFKQLSTHECYYFDAECTKTSCQVVDDYFTAASAMAHVTAISNGQQINLAVDEHSTSTTIPGGDGYQETFRSVSIEQHENDEMMANQERQMSTVTNSTTFVASTAPMESITNIGDNIDGLIPSTGRKVSKMNWLPIVIVTGILVMILICGIFAYLLKMFSSRRREFKPIPSSEGYLNSTQNPTAATASKT
ncbi:hypothetical protein GJ496_003230 [Pomphorhynchus laevis]|nr:hypothetical protein GJ496_003230 [Pomphorhynchus laevis]